MEKMIVYDFKFAEFSQKMGEFLVDCATSYPGGKVESAEKFHAPEVSVAFLTFKAPESVMTYLKLKFGDCIVSRRPKILKNKYKFNTFFNSIEYIKNIKNTYDGYE